MFRLKQLLGFNNPEYKDSQNRIFVFAFIPLFILSVSVGGFKQLANEDIVSKLLFRYGNEVYNIKTKKGDVLGAVREAGVEVHPQDTFSIPRGTRLRGQSIVFEIKKSWPVTIFDGYKRIQGRASVVDPREAIRQNGIDVWAEDIVTDELSFESGTSVGQVIRINRAPRYNLHADGKSVEIRSWAQTVSEIIGGMITLGPKDIISPALNVKAAPGDIVVTRINVVEMPEVVAVPFSTSYQFDYFAPKGTSRVISSGRDGSKKRLLKVTYRNGKEVARSLLSESVVSAPIRAVVKRGLMPSDHPDFNRGWWDVMVAAGSKYGISPVDLFTVASCESHVNPSSKGGGGKYLGMYQYTNSFWGQASAAAGYKGASWQDGVAQIYSTAKYAVNYGWGRWYSCSP